MHHYLGKASESSLLSIGNITDILAILLAPAVKTLNSRGLS